MCVMTMIRCFRFLPKNSNRGYSVPEHCPGNHISGSDGI